MGHQIDQGDRAEWKSHGHNVNGTVEEKITVTWKS
ncbi:MAG: hypothetical protein QOD02_5811 [Mycobacterium sp.]|jgi:hypothetical protein|nr:hypothetical protein [Mycobacterium sp.]MDT5201162.1 hypothetical protein [Mycobacterium sp.]MDT5251498.1 hypothetical protein [Mycobacterium sp.]MDT5342663.1 hypothetical protein [Mycobacterium sp.]MDT7736903.1 hypothetical protein [Mycobacterium sp.]